MAQPATARDNPNVVRIEIEDNGVSVPHATAIPGDSIEFRNKTNQNQLVMFPTPPGSSQPFYPIALFIGPSDRGRLYAQDLGTVTYNVAVPGTSAGAQAGPLGSGPYQIIVGSGPGPTNS